MKEEKVLLEKVGKENPFKVPENYFAELESRVTDNLPDKPEPEYRTRAVTTWDRLKPYAYLAAMFVGAALIIKVVNYNRANDPQVALDEQADYETLFINAAISNAVMDDYSYYLYLADGAEE